MIHRRRRRTRRTTRNTADLSPSTIVGLVAKDLAESGQSELLEFLYKNSDWAVDVAIRELAAYDSTPTQPKPRPSGPSGPSPEAARIRSNLFRVIAELSE